MKKIDSRYRLTLIAAQRANELTTGSKPLINTKSKKPALIALEEIACGKVNYEETKPGKSKKS